jgi:general secretion pathway protein M
MKALIKQRWQCYSPRERLLLLLGGGMLFLLLFRFGLLTPLQAYQQQSEAQVSIAHQELQWLQTALAQIDEPLTTQPAERTRPLSDAIRQSASKHALTLPTFDDSPQQIAFNDIQLPFTTLLEWLNDLENQYAIQASRLILSGSDAGNGIVHISQLVLQRGE